MKGAESRNRRQLHNLVASGHMNDVLAGAFPGFAAHTAALSTRSAWLPKLAEPLRVWPAALFQDNVSFNWLFLNAADMASSRTIRLMTLAQQIAPTLMFCYRHETEMDTDEIAALVEASSPRNGRGMILSCYTTSSFGAPLVFSAFLRKAPEDMPASQWSEEAAPIQDPCYRLARELVLSSGTVSVSLVQRTLKLSYRHARQLIEAMVGDILDRDPGDGTLSIRQAAQATLTKLASARH